MYGRSLGDRAIIGLVAVLVPTFALCLGPAMADEDKGDQGTPGVQATEKPKEGGMPGEMGPMRQEGRMGTMMMQRHHEEMGMMTQLKDLLAEAKKAVEAGEAETASAKIAEAQKIVEERHKTMQERMEKMQKMMEMRQGSGGEQGEAGQGKVVNSRCPIMGTEIDPAKVPDNLTRMYKGKLVGFCCPGCPRKWDQQSDEEKDKKLSAAM